MELPDKPSAFGGFLQNLRTRSWFLDFYPHSWPLKEHHQDFKCHFINLVGVCSFPGGDADFHVTVDHLLGNVLAFPLLQLGSGWDEWR